MTSSSADSNILDQIGESQAEFEKRESLVQAFLPEEGRFERLHKEAESLLAHYPDVDDRPPLFGMLVGVKDVFHVDGFATQAGSRLPSSVLQGRQARCVTRLKNAGALVLGKTVATEFAYFSPGPTRNPHNIEHTPGGSSSGSAAAVAAGFCPLALGTQTIGSIIRPAAYCGVFGMMPSYDRISREGVIALSPSLDHVGFFTPDVAVAKRVAPLLYEEWDSSERSLPKPVLGIPDGRYLDSASGDALARFEATCILLAEAGYKLEHVRTMPDIVEIRARHDLILAAEAARVHTQWFMKYENLYAPKTAELIHRGQMVSTDRLAQALRDRITLRDQLGQLMQARGIDLYISPAAPGAAPKGIDSTGDPIMNLPWTQAGMPTINLPAGKTEDGLPLGLQVTGRPLSDESLLVWAEDLEKALQNS